MAGGEQHPLAWLLQVLTKSLWNVAVWGIRVCTVKLLERVMLFGKISDILMRLINIRYILFYFENWVMLSGKT